MTATSSHAAIMMGNLARLGVFVGIVCSPVLLETSGVSRGFLLFIF